MPAGLRRMWQVDVGGKLTSDDQYVYLRDMVLDKRSGSQPKGNPHLLTLTGFLDDSWAHRSYWIFGTHCSVSIGCSRREAGRGDSAVGEARAGPSPGDGPGGQGAVRGRPTRRGRQWAGRT
ncbi:MAG: hypothetical protein IIB56_02900 [Planctomycetes bacterium]|nr:hypothetical protein [Planctomycetota bacterium]